MMKEGWTFKGINNYFEIEKDSVIIYFDIIFKTQKGMLFCVNIQQSTGKTNGTSTGISKDKTQIVLEHSEEEDTAEISK